MPKKTDHRQLESLAERVRSRLSGKKEVFPLREFPADNVLDWEGNDIDRFLDSCERYGGPLVYLCEWRVTESNVEQDEAFSGHIGELLQLQVAFLQDGYFHTFKEATDLFKEFCEGLGGGSLFEDEGQGAELNKKQATRIRDCILGLKAEQVTEEFIKEFMESDHEDFKFEYRLYQLVSEKYRLPRTDPLIFRRLGDDVEHAFTKFSKTVEERLIEGLVPKLIEWSAKNKRDKILKVDVQVFLSENHLKLENPSVTILWRKADYRSRGG